MTRTEYNLGYPSCSTWTIANAAEPPFYGTLTPFFAGACSGHSR